MAKFLPVQAISAQESPASSGAYLVVKERGSTTWARFRAGGNAGTGRANYQQNKRGGEAAVKIRQSSAESARGVLTPLALSGALLLKKSNAPNMQ